jgi:hypothetical protein
MMHAPDPLLTTIVVVAFLGLNYALYRRITRPSLGLFAQPRLNSGAARDEPQTSYRFTVQNYEEEDLPGPVAFRFEVVGDGELLWRHNERKGCTAPNDCHLVHVYVGTDCGDLSWEYVDDGRTVIITARRMRALKAWAFDIPVTSQVGHMRMEVELQQPSLLAELQGFIPRLGRSRVHQAFRANLDVGDEPVSNGHERSRVPGWWLYTLTYLLSALLYLGVLSTVILPDIAESKREDVGPLMGLALTDLSLLLGVALVSALFFVLLRREPVSAAQGFFLRAVLTPRTGVFGNLRSPRATLDSEDLNDAIGQRGAAAGGNDGKV